jgi:tRNA threonylcarbamoyladenosine biosynthesis protein TsaE
MQKSCQTHHIDSLEELRALAASVAKQLRGGEVLLLYGDLGAGKTTFVQALAQGMNITQPVTSPTFTVVAEYDVVHPSSIERFIHIDLYRLDRVDHSVDEILQQAGNPDCVMAIEWADKLPEAPPQATTLHFSLGEQDGQRQVTICSGAGYSKDNG